MDSLTQIALGASVAVAAMGPRTSPRKAALWGAACGTLPDLDALVDYGDPVLDMTLHRGDSHALLWLTLAAPVIAWVAARVHGEADRYPRWWLAIWLALVTHPLLDAMTVYGTQLARPFTDHPYGVGSVFIIDPAYTLPLAAGVIAALRITRRRTAAGPMRGGEVRRPDGPGAGHATDAAMGRALRWNAIGLAVSTLYLGWSVVAQQHVRGVAERALAAQGIAAERVLVTPAPFNTVLWRVVAMTPDGYHEGFRSLLDARPGMRFDRFERGAALREALAGHPPVERIARFSHGFWAMATHGGRVAITDLRMGQEPAYVFSFVVARQQGARLVALDETTRIGRRPDLGRGLDWLWRRALGAEVEPPR
ncbi:MAG: metal-dependent hydrolase [Burkholderiales bacterium]